MFKSFSPAIAIILAAGLAGCVPPAQQPATPAAVAPAAPGNPMVGGAVMDSRRTIVENAAKSRDHGTLVAAVRAAGLTDTLAGAGPYTLFAPTDAAFGRLPPSTVETLMMPPNRAQLGQLLYYHVVPGRKTAAAIAADISAGRGAARYRTVAGSMISVRMEGGALVVRDANNRASRISQSDVIQSNGVIHVVDTVLLPIIG